MTDKICPIINQKCRKDGCIAFNIKLGNDDNHCTLSYLYDETRLITKTTTVKDHFWSKPHPHTEVTNDFEYRVVAERRSFRTVCVAQGNLTLITEDITILTSQPTWIQEPNFAADASFPKIKISKEEYVQLLDEAKPIDAIKYFSGKKGVRKVTGTREGL